MKNIDLMFCCLGNGLTVCDRSHMEGGDYKIVAHVDSCGVYKLYCKLPWDAVNSIQNVAKREGRQFSDLWRTLSPIRRLDELADYVLTWDQFKQEGGYALLRKSPDETLEIFRKYTCLNKHYIMPTEE